eukprot:g16658.t1
MVRAGYRNTGATRGAGKNTSVTSAGSSGVIISSAQRTPGPLQQEQDSTSRVARSSTAAPPVAPTSSRADAGTQVRQPEHTRTSGIEWERDGDPGDALVISNIAQELQQSENAAVLGGDDGQPVVPLSPNSVLREQWDPEAGVPLRYRRYRNPQPLLDYLSVQTLVDLVTDFNRRLGFISFLIDPPPAPLRMSTVLDALSGGGEVPREELLRQMRDYAQRVLSAGEDLLMERATSSLAPAGRLRLSEDLQAQVLTLRQLLTALEGVQALSPISERSPEGSPPSIAGAAPAASAATRRDAGVQPPTSASAAGSANNSPFDALAPPRPVGLAAVGRVPPGELMSRGVPSAQLPRLSQDGRGTDLPAAATTATPGGGQAAQVGRSSVTFLESGAERGSDTSSSSNDDNLEPLDRNELMRLLGNFYDAPRGLDGPTRTMAAAQTAMIDLNANAPPFTRQTPEFPTWQLVDGGVSAQMTEQQQREVQARNNAFMDTVLRLQQEQRGPCVPGLLTLAKGVRSLVLKRRKRLAARRSLERRRSGEGEEACRWRSPPRAASPSGLGALRSASAATTRWPTPSARHTGEDTALVAWARAKTGASSFRPPPNCADGIIQKCCVPAAEALMRRFSRSERAPSRGPVGASATSQAPSAPPTFGTTGDQTSGGRTSGSGHYPMQPDSSPSQTVVPPSSQGPTTSAAASASPRTQFEIVPEEVDGDNGAGAAAVDVRHEIPRDFLCPITLELMDEPVCVPGERHSYELSALREHLRVRGRFTKIGKQRFRLEGRPPIPGSHGAIVYDSYFTEYPPETLCGYLSRLVRGEASPFTSTDEQQRVAVCGSIVDILLVMTALWTKGHCVVPIDTTVLTADDVADRLAFSRCSVVLSRMEDAAATVARKLAITHDQLEKYSWNPEYGIARVADDVRRILTSPGLSETPAMHVYGSGCTMASVATFGNLRERVRIAQSIFRFSSSDVVKSIDCEAIVDGGITPFLAGAHILPGAPNIWSPDVNGSAGVGMNPKQRYLQLKGALDVEPDPTVVFCNVGPPSRSFRERLVDVGSKGGYADNRATLPRIIAVNEFDRLAQLRDSLLGTKEFFVKPFRKCAENAAMEMEKLRQQAREGTVFRGPAVVREYFGCSAAAQKNALFVSPWIGAGSGSVVTTEQAGKGKASASAAGAVEGLPPVESSSSARNSCSNEDTQTQQPGGTATEVGLLQPSFLLKPLMAGKSSFGRSNRDAHGVKRKLARHMPEWNIKKIRKIRWRLKRAKIGRYVYITDGHTNCARQVYHSRYRKKSQKIGPKYS